MSSVLSQLRSSPLEKFSLMWLDWDLNNYMRFMTKYPHKSPPSGYMSVFRFPEKQSEILLRTVCAAGNMDCRIIRDNYENCWTHNQPGERPSGGVGENHLLG